MAQKRTYSVPYTTTTLDIYEVEAENPSNAVLAAEELRRGGATPTHTRTTKFGVGTPKPTIVDPDALSNEAIAP